MREAAHAASLFSHVNVDIGFVFPILSKHGQKSVLKELMELCPLDKIIYSSSGRDKPEMHAIAVVQAKEVLGEVFQEMVDDKLMDRHTALDHAKRIFKESAMHVYFGQKEVPKKAPSTPGDLGTFLTLCLSIRIDVINHYHLLISWRKSKNTFDKPGWTRTILHAAEKLKRL